MSVGVEKVGVEKAGVEKAGVERVVELFDEMVRPEGGRVCLLAVEGGTLRVEYAKGTNEACETCVFEPDALAAMMQDLVKEHDPSIVEVVVVEVAG